MVYHTHKLLVASPQITDPVFAGKVVFLFRHNDKGAEGIILNPEQIGELGFKKLADSFEGSTRERIAKEVQRLVENGEMDGVPVFAGGPCSTPGLFFLHGYPDYVAGLDDAEKPEFDLGISDSFDTGSGFVDEESPPHQLFGKVCFGNHLTFCRIVESGQLPEGKFRFYSGQSAWGAGQLEEEIEGGAWSVVDASDDGFFNPDALPKAGRPAPPGVPARPAQYQPSWN